MSSPELLKLESALIEYAVHERNSNTPRNQVLGTMKEIANTAIYKVWNDE